MGVVYRAADRRLGRNVALKLLPAEYGEDETFRMRFLRESRLAASIDHPSVIPVYEAGDSDGQLYIAMRYVDGTDLGRLLRAEGRLEPERALALTAQLASALDAAHALGLVHRDVKPSNALVARVGDAEHVYLSDFGLSREVAADATQSRGDGFVGTVRYTAPEVIRSGQADPRSDIYSLGCVLFECLTGEVPFPGPSEAAAIYGHLEQPPPRVSEKRPDLSRAMDAVVARALEKDPRRRWSTGAELVQAAREALAGTRPEPAGRRRVLIAALAVLALAIGGLVSALVDSGDGERIASIDANAIAVIDPDEGSLIGQVALDGAPGAIAQGAGAVWVADKDRGVVSRVDTSTRTIRQTIRVGQGPSALAVGADRVWVANGQDGTVSMISPQTNEVVGESRVARNVDGLCIGDEGVWVASPLDYEVVRLDPDTGRRSVAVRLDVQPGRLACGGGSVWVSSPTGGSVTEISTAAAAPVRSVQVGRGASALALGPSGLWVANSPDGTVARVDPRRGAVTATISLGELDAPADVAVGDDDVWVSSEIGATVARIDPARGEVVERLEIGNRPQAMAVIDGGLWVGIADTGARHRGGTLRLEYFAPGTREELDPSTSATAQGNELLSAVHDGLTGFRRVGGVGGATLVANLAESLPTPSDGGRTYAFRLRAGVTYSTGEPVRAGHIRFGLERALRNQPSAAASFGRIRGAQDCTPRRCDLSDGVVTDDRARTIVFRLTEPDPDLPARLALPAASALPPRIGTAAPARRPLPATGPYRIAELRPGRSVRLERNPRFRSWSAVARPDGFADVIAARFLTSPEGAADRVLAGETDRIGGFVMLPPDTIATLRGRAPGQLRQSIASHSVYFGLNTRVPPFDDVDARRAVAFALDRRAAVRAAGGREVARETCQLLPPGFLGSRPYCPFTVADTGGASGRPDLARARQLARRSGARGVRVVVQAPDFMPPVADVMARTLRRLGFDAEVRVLPTDRHFATAFDPAARVQMSVLPFISQLPSPLDILASFRCDTLTQGQDNLNFSQFCDRRVDRLMDEATRIQAVSPTAADRVWAEVEQRIVDQALAVAAYNRVWPDLVSERLGNFQYNPVSGMLLDQAWVR